MFSELLSVPFPSEISYPYTNYELNGSETMIRDFDRAYGNNTPAWYQGHISESSLFISDALMNTRLDYNGELTVAFGRKTFKEHF
jgi:hypothetical protein